MNTDILVPLAFLVMVTLVLRHYFSSQRLKRQDWHETFRVAVKQSGNVDPDLMQRLTRAVDPQRNDLRKAFVHFAISISILLIGWVAPFQDSQGNQVIMLLALLPGSLCVTYLALWRFWYR